MLQHYLQITTEQTAHTFLQAYKRTAGDATRAKIVINAAARPVQPDGDVPATSHARRYDAPATYGNNLFGRQHRYSEISVLMPDTDIQGRDLQSEVVDVDDENLSLAHRKASRNAAKKRPRM